MDFFSMDQPEKRAHTLFGAGNSEWGATNSWSFNYKDIQHRLISCKNCIRKLEKYANNNECSKCWSWDVERAKLSEKLVQSVGRCVKKPRKLSLELQHKESKKNIKMW